MHCSLFIIVYGFGNSLQTTEILGGHVQQKQQLGLIILSKIDATTWSKACWKSIVIALWNIKKEMAGSMNLWECVCFGSRYRVIVELLGNGNSKTWRPRQREVSPSTERNSQ